MSPGILALVPIRSFASGKSRLSSALDADARRDLAVSLATSVLDVLASIDEIDIAILTSDDDVARWARDRKVVALAPPTEGLNEAAAFGLTEAASRGYRHAAIVHADLAHPAGLRGFFEAVAAGDEVVWIAPDAVLDGTNVLAVPTSVADEFRFGYGPGSCPHHLAAADDVALDAVRWTEGKLEIDVDTDADLVHLRAVVEFADQPR